MSKIRSLPLELSDVMAKAFVKLGIPVTSLTSVSPLGIVAPCIQVQFGDFQCNLAMPIHKQLFSEFKAPRVKEENEDGDKKSKKKNKKAKSGSGVDTIHTINTPFQKIDMDNIESIPKSPQELSRLLLQALYTQDSEGNFVLESDLIKDVSVSPAGFLNIHINPRHVSNRVMASVIQNDGVQPLVYEHEMPILTSTATHYQPADVIEGQSLPLPAYPRTLTIDYSSPNIAKEMHVGHIRSTVIGDSLAKLVEFIGFNVHRDNHVGDWGTQFGMLIEYFNELQAGMHGGLNADGSVAISDLQSFYRAAKVRFDEDEVFHEKAKANVVALQSGDAKCIELWQQLCRISSIEFNKNYEKLKIDPRLQERGESYYNPFLTDVVEELLARGVAVEMNGAVVLLPENIPSQETSNVDKKANENSETSDNDSTLDSEVSEDTNDLASGNIGNVVILRKSMGGFTYGASDMAALRLRLVGPVFYNSNNIPENFKIDDYLAYPSGTTSSIEKDAINPSVYNQALQYNTNPFTLPQEGNEWALYCVDSGQSIHFQRIMEAGASAGWNSIAEERVKVRMLRYANMFKEIGVDVDTSSIQFQSETTIPSNSSDSNLIDTGLIPSPNVRVEHVNFGLVLGTNGKRLRTRSGEQIKLSDLLDEAVATSKQTLESYRLDKNEAIEGQDKVESSETSIFTPELISTLSECIGHSGVKYFDLKRNRISDYLFSYESMCDMKGDTAVYCMYSHARMFRLLQKASNHGKYKDLVASMASESAIYDQTNNQNKTVQLYPSLFAKYLSNKNEHNSGAVLVSAAIAQYASESATTLNPPHYNASTIQSFDINTASPTASQSYITDLVSSITNTTNNDLSLNNHHFSLSHPSEYALALHLARFQDALLLASSHLQMNVLTEYTYSLAGKFANFYRDCNVLNDDLDAEIKEDGLSIQDERVLLVHASAVTMRRCFNLIGVDALKFM